MLTQEQIAEMRRVARGHNEGTDLSEAAAMAAAVVGHIDGLTRERDEARAKLDRLRKSVVRFMGEETSVKVAEEYADFKARALSAEAERDAYRGALEECVYIAKKMLVSGPACDAIKAEALRALAALDEKGGAA